MKILNLHQNTSEWDEMRRVSIGASDCPIIMDASPFKGKQSLWREKVLGEKGYVSAAMKRGLDLESTARDLYNVEYKSNFHPVVGQSSLFEWQIASFDGYSDAHAYTLEIKCPNEDSFFSIKDVEKIPEHWKWQAQHQMSVSGLVEVVFLVYHPDHGHYNFSIFRDEDMINELRKEEEEFYQCMLNYEEPKLGRNEKEFQDREDEEWKQLALEKMQIEKAKRDLLKKEAENKQAIIQLAKGKPSKGHGLTLSLQRGRLSVDYEKIPQIQGIDLTPFTKIGEPTWKLSLNKR